MVMFAYKVAPALAAGNTLVLKPSTDTSILTIEVAKLLQDVLLDGVVNFVTGSGSEIGQAILDHPNIDKLAFLQEVQK